VADLARQRAEVALPMSRIGASARRRKKSPTRDAPDRGDAKGKLDMAQANLERTQTLLGYTKIRSPTVRHRDEALGRSRGVHPIRDLRQRRPEAPHS